MKLVPSKGALVTGLVVFGIAMFLYNRVAPVRKLLGAAA